MAWKVLAESVVHRKFVHVANGTQIEEEGRYFTPVSLALALWSYESRMAQELGLGPTLNEGDLGHPLALLNTPPTEWSRST